MTDAFIEGCEKLIIRIVSISKSNKRADAIKIAETLLEKAKSKEIETGGDEAKITRMICEKVLQEFMLCTETQYKELKKTVFGKN